MIARQSFIGRAINPMSGICVRCGPMNELTASVNTRNAIRGVSFNGDDVTAPFVCHLALHHLMKGTVTASVT